MKIFYKISLVSFLLFLFLTQPNFKANAATCNWKNLKATTNYWDSCAGKKNKYSVNAYIYFGSKACLTYQWTVNGKNAGTNYLMNSFPITANGTYTICVKVTDSCNRCDTTYCSTRTFSCVTNVCNWKARYPYPIFSDSCAGKGYKYSVNGYISFNYSKTGCFKYQWTVNSSVAGTARFLNYIVTQNGTYVVCVKVTDTCNSCDTTFCSTRTITCVPTQCNWKNLKAATGYWDSCNTTKNRFSLNAYIAFNPKACFKYQWTVNNKAAGTGYIMNYPITQNGTYSVCVKVTDTCNNCDTLYCTTRTITCVPTSGCNWKSRNPYFYTWDSCSNTTKSLYGYIAFNFSGNTCFKYVWSINGKAVSISRALNYPITQNGTYAVCMKVIDTCNNCDTTFCSTRTISCIKSSCNWKIRTPAHGYWDTCAGKKNKYSLNGYALFTNYYYKSCLKYQWTVNGNKAGNGDFFSYPITANGTYAVCVKVTDTCNNCDTSYCTTRTFSCVSNGKCNWKSRAPNSYFWDSCNTAKGRYSVNAYIAFNPKTCLKYQWTVNGSAAGNGYVMNYQITKNGTYSVCVKVTDTCNNCDTTYCNTRTISCITGGINKNNKNNKNENFKIYPNPTTGVVNLELMDGKSTYYLYNSTGQLLQTGFLNNGNNILDMTPYSNGFYFIKISTINAILTEKISVEKR